MLRISKQQVLHNLETALGEKVGMDGLETLIYGWRKKHHMTSSGLYQRDWMTYPEVESLSTYAGYDLTQNA